MSKIEVRRVISKQDLKQFIDFYYELYRDNEYAVPFLRFDELNTLNKHKNPSFDFCDAEYFLAFKEGKVVGRVAAIINRCANEQWKKKQVRFGWFDFIDDLEVSKALLMAVEKYGKQRGMTEMAGPLGFTDMDREGMMIEGFDRLSTAYVIYNYPYYPKHIEAIGGFEKDNDWMEYRIKVPEVTPEKFAKTAQMIERRYNLHAHKFTSDELLHHDMGHRVFEILNETYKDLYDFQKLSERQIDQLVNDYIKKADLNLVTAVVDCNYAKMLSESQTSSGGDSLASETIHLSESDKKEIALLGGKMVGFGISFPSFAHALQKTKNGKLFPMGWWHMLNVLKWHKTDTVDLLLIGVLPEYRAKGANAIIFADLIEQYRQYGFKWAEAMPQMETNTKMRNQWQYLEAEQHRRRRCFKKKI